jgi:hypothetical protein
MRRNSFDVYIVGFGWVVEQAKAFMRDDFGTSCGPKPTCATKVVGVAVRNDDGMHTS